MPTRTPTQQRQWTRCPSIQLRVLYICECRSHVCRLVAAWQRGRAVDSERERRTHRHTRTRAPGFGPVCAETHAQTGGPSARTVRCLHTEGTSERAKCQLGLVLALLLLLLLLLSWPVYPSPARLPPPSAPRFSKADVSNIRVPTTADSHKRANTKRGKQRRGAEVQYRRQPTNGNGAHKRASTIIIIASSTTITITITRTIINTVTITIPIAIHTGKVQCSTRTLGLGGRSEQSSH